ncbi:Deaminated glutathione amidase [Seminavis robusta]|uniref:Deaminated glutathione amidase n=1 Tax=Seminavis robusta TaxID=568900 RepID=A0A9N8HQ98_9STRA|nr:Deaminated glutathione amidase [Seminavis robusta]|eukprot:Sro1265_g257440.1 Deaminated glutathione amidase (349) ;mRNA; r:3604-4912
MGEPSPFSYSPQKLLQSYAALKAKETSSSVEASSDATANESSRNHPPGTFSVAAIQITASGIPNNDVEQFWVLAQQAVQEAATAGANLILLPELFLGPYFCQSQEASLMALAEPAEENFVIERMRQLAKQYQVVLPISFYERKNNALYNSVVMIDADGSILGTYRKSHIPDGTGYQEKFYFTPGDTGFKVFRTKVGTVGVAICWDQWFPEAARAMAVQGADILLYPTAIGSEPQDPTINSADHWQRVMQGHAAANMVPVVASNRYGTEVLLHEDGSEKQRITFYGRSFITDETGAIVQEAKVDQQKPFTILSTIINPSENRATRSAWGLFRDRRPELYGVLQTKDGAS